MSKSIIPILPKAPWYREPVKVKEINLEPIIDLEMGRVSPMHVRKLRIASLIDYLESQDKIIGMKIREIRSKFQDEFTLCITPSLSMIRDVLRCKGFMINSLDSVGRSRRKM